VRATNPRRRPHNVRVILDHVTIRVADVAASRRFYDTVLAPLGLTRSHDEWGDFSLVQGEPVTQNLHIGFAAETKELVHAFHTAGIQAGYQDDGAPGPRPQYTPGYYGAFLRAPDGNSIEALTDPGDVKENGKIDHLWLRSGDLPAQKRFYESLGIVAISADGPERLGLRTEDATFSFVPGEPLTRNVHLAFGAATNDEVHAFHEQATRAGYRDNGAPGERAVYHPGYYGAFVLDPDGHNIEVVNHNR
jgi:catechol 2,3-dioxygenase-like lactoylglutathione lyase family enzyme